MLVTLMRLVLSKPWIALLFVIVRLSVGAQSPVQLRFESVPAAITQLIPTSVRLIALDATGAIDASVQGTATLSARRRDPAPALISVTPSSVQLVNGVWAGTLTISEAGEAVTLVAMAADGRLFESSPISVAPGPTLQLQLPAAALDAREATAGPLGTAVVSRPAPTTESLLVTLALDQPGEFGVPATVIIPAGADSASFTLTNLDDAVADGQAHIRLTASAPGLVSAESWLLNDDNEIGSLFLLTPAALVEGAANASEPGEVVLSEPARHDVVVRLNSDPVFEVPPSVVIPAGSDSATFPIRAIDDSINQPHGARWNVRAMTSEWPLAEQAIQIFDDDLSAAEFDLPGSIIEGESVAVRVHFTFPSAFDRVLTFSEVSLRLELPSAIRIPAMATEVNFVIRVRDNLVLNPPEQASFQPLIDGATYNRVGIAILDNDAAFTGVAVAIPPAVFADEPVPIQIQLVNDLGSVARTNLQGEATLNPSADAAVYPLSFSNGIFAASLTFPTAAVDTAFHVSVGHLDQDAAQFDVVEGHRLAGPFADLAASPASTNRVLALGGGTTNSGSTLIEIDVRTGLTNRTLTLPLPAQLLAVSESGQTAWCASSNGMLQRVHLPDFSLREEVNLVRPGSAAFPLEMVVLAGTEDRLVLSVITNLVIRPLPRSTQLIVVIDGSRRPLETNFVSNVERPALAAGPEATQALLDNGAARLLNISADGVRFGNSVPGPIPFPIPLANLIRVGDRYFRGSGDAFTVSPLAHLPAELQPGMVAAAGGYRVYLGTNGTLRVFNPSRDLLLGTHRVPWPESDGLATRLVATLDSTFAALLPDRSAIHAWRSPVASTVPADLAIVGQGPSQVPVATMDPIMTPWHWIVTNRGPGTAYLVTVTTDRGLKYDLGTLPQGASRSIEDPRYIGMLGMIRGRAQVESPTSDLHPDDNTADLTTAVVEAAPPWTSQWLGVRDIAPSADGAFLWIAQTPPGTVTNTVVSTIDPATGAVAAILEHPDFIDRLHPTADGRFLYLRIGTQQVARWNLAERRFDLQLNNDPGTVLDLLPLPGNGQAFVLASAHQMAVFDDAVSRPNVIHADADFRFLTFAADRLWVHEPLKLIPYRVSSQGLQPDGDAIRVRSDLPLGPFTSDGRRLFGQGTMVDLATRQARDELEFRWITPDLAGNGTYALRNGTDIVRLDPETLQPTASQSFLWPNQMPLQMTRCGPDALAFRFDSGVLWLKSYPVIAAPGGGDIAVSITPPAQRIANATQDYHITITNHSDVAAHRIELECRLGEFLRLSREVPSEFIDFYGRAWLRLDALGPHGSRTITLPLLQFQGPMSLDAQVRSSDLGDDPGNNLASVTGSIENLSG
ncbi:MAG: hypothetical protein JNK85_29280, partial [Verrucomicrobiales bacterium]|nr:hypothetical protein [Verrucomicrobiales bacterium]